MDLGQGFQDQGAVELDVPAVEGGGGQRPQFESLPLPFDPNQSGWIGPVSPQGLGRHRVAVNLGPGGVGDIRSVEQVVEMAVGDEYAVRRAHVLLLKGLVRAGLAVAAQVRVDQKSFFFYFQFKSGRAPPGELHMPKAFLLRTPVRPADRVMIYRPMLGNRFILQGRPKK